MSKPKLEIVRTEDDVDIYIDGRRVTSHTGHLAKLEAVTDVARELGHALGADVIDADEPSPQPYRYYVVFEYDDRDKFGTRANGATWVDLDTEIGGPDGITTVQQMIFEEFQYERILITNFICADGPY